MGLLPCIICKQHNKYISVDYLTGELIAIECSVRLKCKLCLDPVERIKHIRERIMPELLNKFSDALDPRCQILNNQKSVHFTQFLLNWTINQLEFTIQNKWKQPKGSRNIHNFKRLELLYHKWKDKKTMTQMHLILKYTIQ